MGTPRLALGTVQFGLDYGIANTRGRVKPDEVARILGYAAESSIDCIDTAAAYGMSEQVLGVALERTGGRFRIVSKLPDVDGLDVGATVTQSLQRLRVPSLYGYIFHSFDTYLRDPALFDSLRALKERGTVDRIGFSLYFPAQYEEICRRGLPLDLLQFPFNALDQRFASFLPDMAARGIEVHVRSVFLQGLLLMDPSRMDPRFRAVGERARAMRGFCATHGLRLESLLFGVARRRPEISCVVVGVDGLDNLVDNVMSWGKADAACLDQFPYREMVLEDEQVILPMNWKK